MFYYLKITFRNLRRGGIYSVINIGGLAIGMAATILIMLWVYHEWSYDRFHEKEGQLYQIWNHNQSMGSFEFSPDIIGSTLVEDYAEITDMTRYKTSKQLCSYENKKLNISTGFVDPAFLSMFSFPLLQGDINQVLNESYSIVLTEDAAKRIFAGDDPIGKQVLLQNKRLVTVTGIMADLPANTIFSFDALLPYLSLFDSGTPDENWSYYNTVTYVELQTNANPASVNESIKDIIKQHTNLQDQTEPFLYPISNWHLYQKVENKKAAGGLIESLRLFSLVAFLILLIACINFMNLSTARGAKKAKEVGVRKIAGAGRLSLIRYFLGESVLATSIAALFALGLVKICLPYFNSIMGKQLSIEFGNIGFWAILLVFILFSGILAGSYPSFYLSSFQPIKVLKGIFNKKKGVITSRKVLIVTQFASAIVLIVATLMVHRQIQYAQERNIGYDKDQLICVDLNDQTQARKESIRSELLNSGAAVSVACTSAPMTERWSASWGINWKGKDENQKMIIDRLYVDAGWTQTTGVIILQGRDIDIHTYTTDSTAVLLNASALKIMGFEEPIGEIIQNNGADWYVVGVVQDYVVQSPYEQTRPMIIGGPAGSTGIMQIKLNKANTVPGNLAAIERIFKSYNPDFPFEYKFVDESYARKFAQERRTGTLASWFATLAVIISCLGLFGLSAYMADTRRKEIGVRKVLGASVLNIASLLSYEFLILVSISFAIATPIAWWAMNQWLNGFSYRTNIPWWLFAMVALLAIGVALITVSFQAIKAAIANPVKAIKSE